MSVVGELESVLLELLSGKRGSEFFALYSQNRRRYNWGTLKITEWVYRKVSYASSDTRGYSCLWLLQ
jgi:hypothetical protein